MICGPSIRPRIPWYKAPFLDFHEWSQAAQRLWGFLLDPDHYGATRFHFKDWELAERLHVGRRCIQKALWFLQNIVGVITRFRRYGRDAGRIIEITIDLARSKPKATPPHPPSTAKSSVPNVPPIPSTSPEQLAAASAAQSEPESGEPTAEEQAAADALLAACRARRAEAEARARAKAEKARAAAGPRWEVATDGTMTAQQALEAKRRALGIRTGGPPESPSGP